MSDCNQDCSSCGKDCEQRSFLEAPHKLSNIKNIISVSSGKGGVGKSLITTALAVSLNKLGYKVGILDADITGPSIPKSFNVHGQALGTEDGIIPMETGTGIKLISMNLLLTDENMPVIWRGPVIGGVVKQLWTDVMWGDLDYLLIDMPPGTGDVPLTVYQTIPLTGAIIVTSPQDLVSMIVKKSYIMTTKMNINVLGIVENMCYITCPDCGKKIFPFGEDVAERLASEIGVEILNKLPINPEYAKLCDSGRAEELDAKYFDVIAKKVVEKTSNL